jgi:hypothetical protein
MGTRCLTVLVEAAGDGQAKDREVAVLYRQMDGFPEGHGQELVDLLAKVRVVNGYSLQDVEDAKSGERVVANGSGCLFARLVAELKGKQLGSIYLEAEGTRDRGEEYIYKVEPSGSGVGLECWKVRSFRCGKTWGRRCILLFSGPVSAWQMGEVEKADEQAGKMPYKQLKALPKIRV